MNKFTVGLLFGAVFTLPPASAQIFADPHAPANQQPTVLSTANGIAQVNIQTPSAAGVSRNTYRQFDVPQAGLILNNSRTDSATQLGGYVQGNPWLAGGSARQEVRTSAAEYLRANLGYLSRFSEWQSTYETEKAETTHFADATLEGLRGSELQGFAQSHIDAVTALGALLMTMGEAAVGDTQAQQDLRKAAGEAWEFVKDPNNLPGLLGAMSADDREALAQAYEEGNGTTVGYLLGAHAANAPFYGGGVLGKAGKVAKINQGGKVGKAGGAAQTPDIASVNFGHVIGGDYNPTSKKVSGGHSLLSGNVRELKITGKPDANGVYQAIVEIKTPTGEWKTKMIGKTNRPQPNSMFPRGWREEKIKAEINSAWSRRQLVDGKENIWNGMIDSGVEISVYIKPTVTAFPIYDKGDKK